MTLATDGLRVIERFMASVAQRYTDRAIYRGHADVRWLLTPAAFRGLLDNGIRSQTELRKWKEMAARFGDHSTTDLEWLVLAQHYGVATPLLDWTTNPLIALYFACSTSFDRAKGTPAAGNVHTLSGLTLSTAPANRSWDPLSDYNGPPLLIDTMVMNPRTRAQDSIMTIHQRATSEPVGDFNSEIFTIQAREKRATLQALKMLGISSDRLFVDISVVAREFTDELIQADALRNLARSRE